MAHWSGKWIKEIPLPSEKLSAAHGRLLFYSTMTDGVEQNAGVRSYQLWREEVRRRGRAAGSDPRTWWTRLRKVLQLTGPQAVAILVPCNADNQQEAVEKRRTVIVICAINSASGPTHATLVNRTSSLKEAFQAFPRQGWGSPLLCQHCTGNRNPEVFLVI